ncbi:MAG: hypothetical protein Q7V57_06080 [Actinomycetota bacterium]|nr:hypothetical protein [Actinomycetota bacterium]
MTAFDNVRRKRTTVMLAAGLAVLVAVAGLAYVGVKALRRYEGATKVGSDSIRIPSTPVGMLATVNAENRLTSITVMVLPPNSGLGGSILSLPVSVDSTLSVGPDRTPLSEIYAASGIDELALAVESTLSVTLDVYQVADPAAAEALLAPLAAIPATLPSAVGEEIPAGAVTLTPAQAVQVINHVVEGQPDRDRRGNVEAVWAGVATAIGSGILLVAPADATSTTSSTASTVAVTPITIASFPELLQRLYSGPVGARALSASPLDASLNPTGKDAEAIERAEAVMVLASIAPRSMSQPAPGLNYRIEAPPGYEQQVVGAVAIILLSGGNVQSVYLNGEVREETVMLVGDSRLNTAADADGMFGAVVDEPKIPIEGIDVILQLGTTWLAAPPAATTSTTTTVVAPTESSIQTETTITP